MQNDLERAGIPKWTPEGKLDFHALRTTFCTLVIESGANLKEAMSLMRHTTPDLTANVYARARPDQLQRLAEDVGRTLKSEPKCVSSVSEAVVGAEDQADNTNDDKEIDQRKDWWRRRESNPPPKSVQLSPTR